jgi:uncharacterized protein YjbJ (UPF0337 family)
VRRGNHIDCSLGVVFARWWRLGIFSLAKLASGGASPTVQTKLKEEDTMKSSTKDQAKGKFHEVKGKIKEKVGKATKNPNLENEGATEKTVGKVQKKIGQVEKVLGD